MDEALSVERERHIENQLRQGGIPIHGFFNNANLDRAAAAEAPEEYPADYGFVVSPPAPASTPTPPQPHRPLSEASTVSYITFDRQRSRSPIDYRPTSPTPSVEARANRERPGCYIRSPITMWRAARATRMLAMESPTSPPPEQHRGSKIYPRSPHPKKQ